MKIVEVSKIEAIPVGSMKMFAVEGQEILVVNLGNKYYALSNRCTHAGGDLSKGRLEGNVVICPRHGSHFDVTNGNRISGLAKNNLPVFETKVEGQMLEIKI
jgi:3-phenylpropionate/trans-cinnamate dioxygenase ferredoxin component